MNGSKSCKEQGSQSEFLKYCAILDRDMAVFCEAVLPGECIFDRKWMGPLSRETSSGGNEL